MKLTISACLAGAILVAGASDVAGESGATPSKISGSTALALAGVIAPLSPLLSGAEKKAVASCSPPMPTFPPRSRSW